ncbi:hypothetical protein BDV37DRAFT_261879 [Aspergillus pseudonomiae]|uniref:Uncharacterized protein n=1 Tax=Aspergillus pseudonomiae TaxID=1506151 RepID=A0A5N7CYG3_9EURO|nr:uncharacterized protein BDV37DRAFT_261879 [Aspergillus pseudonomiae]KAE8398999.1 hypothetical protein BDV37DRAFT_261879 [Aspergillus pseudonomiae]
MCYSRVYKQKHGAIMKYTIFAEGFQGGPRDIPPKTEDCTFTKGFCPVVERLLPEGNSGSTLLKVVLVTLTVP